MKNKDAIPTPPLSEDEEKLVALIVEVAMAKTLAQVHNEKGELPEQSDEHRK